MTHKQRDKPSEAFQDNFARLQFYSLVEEYRAAEKHLQECLNAQITANANKAEADRLTWEANLNFKLLARRVNKFLDM